jgi:hypothetical protein
MCLYYLLLTRGERRRPGAKRRTAETSKGAIALYQLSQKLLPTSGNDRVLGGIKRRKSIAENITKQTQSSLNRVSI